MNTDVDHAPVLGDISPPMTRISGGLISLKDEGTGRYWTIKVKPFLLARFSVTQEQYRSIENDCTPGPGQHRKPIVDVSWNDAVRFCNLLSRAAGLIECYTIDATDQVTCDWTASGYRLPTEAEWEYACRAGTNGARYGELEAVAWYSGNSEHTVHDVGAKEPNAWGLHDMLGNVWEWCWDLYDEDMYGSYRVFRGGGWSDPGTACRASCRRKSHPTFRIDDLGFRVARSIADIAG